MSGVQSRHGQDVRFLLQAAQVIEPMEQPPDGRLQLIAVDAPVAVPIHHGEKLLIAAQRPDGRPGGHPQGFIQRENIPQILAGFHAELMGRS